VVKSHKDRIKDDVKKGLGAGQGSSQSIEIKLLLYAPEVAKVSEMRSSRDRIARGTIINVALMTIVWTIVVYRRVGPFSAIVCFLVGVVFVVICWNMWFRFQTLSYRYAFKAYDFLEDKLKSDRSQVLASASNLKSKDD